MLGDFINRGLVMVLGYAYPAFECFKTVEKNKVDIEELRFWCQYWMIIAALSVVERIGDLFISWVPFYGEMKLAFIVYLWYPKTKGTTVVYDSLFKPLVSKHETDIDRNIQELKLRAWDLIVYHWQSCAHVGQSAFFNAVQYVLQQSYKMKAGNTESSSEQPNPPPTPKSEMGPSTPARRQQAVMDSPASFSRNVSKRWPPAAEQSTPRTTSFKSRSTPQPDVEDAQTEYVHVDEVPQSPGSSPKSKFGPVGSIKLRKTQPLH